MYIINDNTVNNTVLTDGKMDWPVEECRFIFELQNIHLVCM